SAEGRVVERARPGQVTEHAPRERVAGTGRVADLFERVRRRPEGPGPGQEERAVLGSLDHDGPRTEREDLARRLEDVVRPAKLARLGLVDGDDLDARPDRG